MLLSSYSRCSPMEIDDPLLNAKESANLLNISMPTFWRRVADGTVPKPLKIGSLSRWPLTDIKAVIVLAMDTRDRQWGSRSTNE